MQQNLIFPLLIILFCKEVKMSERDVFAHIFENYENRMKPVRNESAIITVQIQMNLISLLEVNAPQEYIKMALTFDHDWHDDFLTWDPSKFGGTTRIRVPADMVWKPDVTVVSTVLKPEYIIDKEDLMLEIEYTGDIYFDYPIVLTNHCPMVTDEFPFDSQECIIELSSWMFAIDEMELEHTGIQTSIENNNTEWDVLPYENVSTLFIDTFGVSYRNLNYHQKIRRKPTYYVWVIIVPTFIITGLSIAGIFAPFSNTGEREEKTTLGLTTLLTLAVILSMVTGEMPRATNLPLLGQFPVVACCRFILFEISICVVSMALSVCIMFLHERATTRIWIVPEWLKRTAICNKSHRIQDADSLSKPAVDEEPAELTKKSKTFLDFQQFSETIAKLTHLLHQHEMIEERKHQWIMIFDRLDLAFFLGFQFVHVIYFLMVFRTYLFV